MIVGIMHETDMQSYMADRYEHLLPANKMSRQFFITCVHPENNQLLDIVATCHVSFVLTF